MNMSPGAAYPKIPDEKAKDIRHAVHLELATLFFLSTIVVVMYLVMGSSQAMKTAWVEDLLSLLPASMFLVTAWLERKPPSEKYPFGLHRVGSLGFFAAACALLVLGLYLLFESAMSLIRMEHPTIGTVSILGERIWLGWLMIAALAYSVIPPVILGRMKKKPSRSISDKILHTDADMNAADWQTGLAGIAGIIGISLGWWWADAAAAGLISFSILRDGVTNCRIALAELLDGTPRELASSDIHPSAARLRDELRTRFPGAEVRLRETGRYMRAVVVDSLHHQTGEPGRHLAGDDQAWRLIEVSRALDFEPPSDGKTAQTPKR